MKCVFATELGFYYDVFDSIVYCLNDCHREVYKGFNAEVNTEVEKAVKVLSKFVNKNTELLEVYFNAEAVITYPIGEFDNLWECNSDETFVEKVKKINKEKIRYEAVKQLGKYTNSDEAVISQILMDNTKLMELIESVTTNDEMKWKLLRLLNNSEKWAEKFEEFIIEYLPIYKSVIDKYKKSINAFNSYIEEKIKVHGASFIYTMSGNILDAFGRIEDYEEVYISTCFFNSISCVLSEVENKAYILVGRDFEATVKLLSGEDEHTKMINTFKNLSDKTRFNILMFILGGEVYSQEIADKFSLSMPTVSYHMNYLGSVKLIKFEKRGQKIFYVINKESIKELVNYINKVFKLEES